MKNLDSLPLAQIGTNMKNVNQLSSAHIDMIFTIYPNLMIPAENDFLYLYYIFIHILNYAYA